MSELREREALAAELAQCQVTPQQLVQLRWLIEEYDRGDAARQRLVADVMRNMMAVILVTAPRKTGP